MEIIETIITVIGTIYFLWFGYFILCALKYGRMQKTDPEAAEIYRHALEQRWVKNKWEKYPRLRYLLMFPLLFSQ